MPLIKIEKKKQEEEYIFTEYEKVLLARKMFPEEQIKSVNHNERLLDAMLEDEIRDMLDKNEAVKALVEGENQT